MSTKISAKFVFMIALSILVMGVVFYYLKGEIKTTEVVSAVVKKYVTEQDNEPAADVNNSQPSQQSLRKTSAMAKEFYASKDLRVFVEQVKKRPQEGGISYAYLEWRIPGTFRKCLPACPIAPLQTLSLMAKGYAGLGLSTAPRKRFSACRISR